MNPKYTTEGLRDDFLDASLVITAKLLRIDEQNGVKTSYITLRDYPTMQTKLNNYIHAQQAALLDEVGRRLPEWEYKKLEPCPVCGDYQYSHSPGSHHDYAINQVRGILEAIRKEIV